MRKPNPKVYFIILLIIVVFYYIIFVMKINTSSKNVESIKSQSEMGEISKEQDIIANKEINEDIVEDIIYDPVTITSEKVYVDLDSYIIDGVDCILQNPELPTGCEITSLCIALNYYGIKADKLDLADNYLNKIPAGSDYPSIGFWGNPRNYHSFGCDAPVIVEAGNKYLYDNESNLVCKDTTGTELNELLKLYINENNPVIIWATINMAPSYNTTVYKMPDGNTYTWKAPFHCMVLYGYDKINNLVYISDPLEGNITYNYDTFETRFKEIGMQSVIIE